MKHTHIKFFNKAMRTGQMTEAQMLHEHPLELADIKAGLADRRPAPAILRKRRRIYFPIASVLTLGMVAGIFGFINTENTALTTVPPQDSQPAQIYLPQTPTPRPTSSPTAKAADTPSATGTPGAASAVLSWDGSVGAFFQVKCLPCHGELVSGGLVLSTYASAMKGGDSGVVFVPGDAAHSLMIVKFESGAHPNFALTPEELTMIKAWLDAGALEK